MIKNYGDVIRSENNMQIAGLEKFSMIDYPGKISAIIFCRGCPLKCRYCHNAHLQNFDSNEQNVSRETIDDFLKRRQNMIDAIVFSGGEPLANDDLREKMFHVKQCYHFLIGLHTSGFYPENLKNIIDIVDWVGLDIKAPLDDPHLYNMITGNSKGGDNAMKSLNILIDNNVDFEVRTTFDSRFLNDSDMLNIAVSLNKLGIKKWFIQQCILRFNKNDVKLNLPSAEILEKISGYIDVEIRK